MTQEAFYEELLGFSDLKVSSIEKNNRKVIFHCELKSKVSNCPNYLKPTAIVNQYESCKIQDLKNIGTRSMASNPCSSIFLPYM